MQFQTELRSNEGSFDEKDVLDDCVAGQPKGTEKFFSPQSRGWSTINELRKQEKIESVRFCVGKRPKLEGPYRWNSKEGKLRSRIR